MALDDRRLRSLRPRKGLYNVERHEYRGSSTRHSLRRFMSDDEDSRDTAIHEARAKRTSSLRRTRADSGPIDSDSNDVPVTLGPRQRRPVAYYQAGVDDSFASAVANAPTSRKRARDEPSRSTRSMRREEHDDSDDDDDVEPTIRRRRYPQRENRAEVQRFQYTFNDSTHSMRVRTPRYDTQNDEINMAFRSPARRSRPLARGDFSRQRRRKGSTSTETSGDEARRIDERKFERRAAKSMDKARRRFLPLNIEGGEAMRGVLGERIRAANLAGGSSCADIDPMSIDRSVTFESVGGLSRHVHALKEMVLFPLLYPEVFSKFAMTPPRGVIFYGPPGTGKTLVARALANECSAADRRVAFFMRKGADCLSKWVGESERQLRVLFDQAYTMRPSIIFFDEIDGLAPVRSSRQDQIHSSIVSTLLALMDGLDSRDEIVVIGATNRLDTIDPALRRPGRFDRELRFSLPDLQARRQILDIHTRKWQPAPPESRILDTVADKTQGCCGADLRAICNEAALIALRRTYPQIYDARVKLAIDHNAITVDEGDFLHALDMVQPASRRNLNAAPARALTKRLYPLLKDTIDAIIKTHIRGAFDPKQAASVVSLTAALTTTCMRTHGGARLLVCGTSPHCGQTAHVAPALLHYLDYVPVHSLAIANIYAVSSHRSAEEAVAEILSAATSSGGYGANSSNASVLYIPAIDQWHAVVPSSVWHTLQGALEALDAQCSLMVLATAHCTYAELHEDVRHIFSLTEHVTVSPTPSTQQRREYFSRIINDPAHTSKPPPDNKPLPKLPVALRPAPPRQLSAEEKKILRKQEESMLRQLRLFLREMLGRLFRDRRFQAFTRPVEEDEAPDYHEYIERPMDLSLMMERLDNDEYMTTQQWLDDVDLICHNCLEYNPNTTQEGKRLRHLACCLRDTAHALIDQELDEQFEERLERVRQLRAQHCGNATIERTTPDREARREQQSLSRQQRFEHRQIIKEEKAERAQSAEPIEKAQSPMLSKRLVATLPPHERHKRRIAFGRRKFHAQSHAASAIRRKYEKARNLREQRSSQASSASSSNDNAPSPGPMTRRSSDVGIADGGSDLEILRTPDARELTRCVNDAVHATDGKTLAVIDALGVELQSICASFIPHFDRTTLPALLQKAIRRHSQAAQLI